VLRVNAGAAARAELRSASSVQRHFQFWMAGSRPSYRPALLLRPTSHPFASASAFSASPRLWHHPAQPNTISMTEHRSVSMRASSEAPCLRLPDSRLHRIAVDFCRTALPCPVPRRLYRKFGCAGSLPEAGSFGFCGCSFWPRIRDRGAPVS